MKHTENRKFRRTVLASAITAALFTITPETQALVLNAEVNTTLNGIDTNYVQDKSSESYVSAWSSPSGRNGFVSSYITTETLAYQDGDFRLLSSGEGIYQSEGKLSSKETVSNNSSTANSYEFNFTIASGYINAVNTTYTDGNENFKERELSDTEFLRAGYQVDILLNDVSVWNSGTTIERDSNGVAFNHVPGGVELGAYVLGSGTYSWDEFTGTLDLGIFNVDDTFSLEYLIRTFAEGHSEPPDKCDVGYGPSCISGVSEARFGDPNTISYMPINSSNLFATPAASNSVPEPGTALLLGAGLAGLARARRRRILPK